MADTVTDQGQDALSQDIMDVFGVDLSPAEPAPQAPATGEPSANAVEEGAAPSAPHQPEPAPSSTPAEAVPSAAPSQPAAPAPAAAAAPETSTPAPVTPPAAPTAEQLELAALREFKRNAEVAAAKPAPQAQPTVEGTGPEAEEPPVRYGLTIPDQLTEVIFGEDAGKASQAISFILNRQAEIVHANVVKQLRAEMETHGQRLLAPQREEEAAKDRQSAQQQYWDAFPDHNKPTIRLLVTEAASTLAAENPGIPWGPEFIAALGHRVNAQLAELAGKPATPALGTPVPTAPAASIPPATRAAPPPSSAPTGQEEIGALWDF